MKFAIIIIGLTFSVVDAIIPPPSGLPVGVKVRKDWEKDQNERMSIVLENLEEFGRNIRALGSSKTNINSWLQSSHKTNMRGRLNLDLKQLRDMLGSNNQLTLKRREEFFGEICDTWMKHGVIGARFERWVGEEDGPFHHLAFCIPSKN